MMRRPLTLAAAVLIFAAAGRPTWADESLRSGGELDARAIRSAERHLESLDRDIGRGLRRIEGLVEGLEEHVGEKEAQLASLETARREALAFIMDEGRFYEEGETPVGMQQVRDLTEAVRARHEFVSSRLDRDIRDLMRLSAGDAAGLIEEIEALAAQRVEEARALADSGRPVADAPAGLSDVSRAALRMRCGQPFDAEHLSPWARAALRRIGDYTVLQANEAFLRTSLPRDGSGGVLPQDPEAEQVRITNEYRMMMGLPALRLDAHLVSAARGHSEEMRRLRYFSHDSPTPGRTSVSMRCDEAGYPVVVAAVGENICQGYTSARNAHEGWLTSPGHHRNILCDLWHSMGAGQAGEFWTQDFGSE